MLEDISTHHRTYIVYDNYGKGEKKTDYKGRRNVTRQKPYDYPTVTFQDGNRRNGIDGEDEEKEEFETDSRRRP